MWGGSPRRQRSDEEFRNAAGGWSGVGRHLSAGADEGGMLAVNSMPCCAVLVMVVVSF